VEILLVRHGESVGNAEDRMQGTSDYPLSERGRGQARALGKWLLAQGLGCHRLYASPLARARETAEIVSALCGGEPPTIEPSLAELNAGELEGLTFDEIGRRFPSYIARGVGDLGDFSEYGGESYGAVQGRAQALFDQLDARHRVAGERIALVGHGGFNFQLLKLLICRPVPRTCVIRMGNCSATLVRLRDVRGTYMGEVLWHVPVDLMGERGAQEPVRV
jgi:broad specificity phosphatase PhoE